MKSLKRGAITATGVLALLMGGTAQADLLEYSFSAVDGSQRTLSPGDTYANPSGPITFALSAGVDRKVRLSIISTSGDVVVSKTSKLLGANDRITVGGKDYYGAFLSIAGLNEGKYSIKSEILSAQGLSVQSETESLVVDTTAPKAEDTFIWTEFAGLGGSIDMIGTGTDSIGLEGVYDANGITRVTFFTKHLASGEVRKKTAAYDSGTQKVNIDLRGNVTQRDLFTHDDSLYLIGFEIEDSAGNINAISRESYADVVMPSLEYSDIWDEKSGKWIPYQPGMTVGENPIKLRLKTDTKSLASQNINGIGWVDKGNWDFDIQGEVTYITGSGNWPLWFAPSNGKLYWRLRTASGLYRDFRPSQLNINLKDGVTLAPQASPSEHNWMMQYQLNGASSWQSGIASQTTKHIDKIGGEFEITGIRFTLENKATYPTYMRASTNFSQGPNKYFSCVVSVGEQSCDVANVAISIRQSDFSVGGGYANFNIQAGEADSSGGYTDRFGLLTQGQLMIAFDFNKPLIEDVKVIDKTIAATFRETEEYDLSTSDSWRFGFDSIKAYAIDSQNQKTELPLLATQNFTRYSSRKTFSYSKLATGVYTLELSAIDVYDREVIYQKSNVVIDKTPPILKINHPSSGIVSTLDEITIDVTDNISESPKITSVNIKGGPASDDIYLSVRKESESLYRLEYPVVFPSLKEGEEYRITVVAEDDQLNETSKTTSFTYNPPQVSLADGMDGKLMIPAVTQEFQRLDGGSIIQTNPLTLSDGSTVSGTYDVFATLRSDAEVPLVVNGIRIEPGQTMSVMSQHDFSTSGGRIDLPLRPAVAGVEGSSNLLVMTSAPNSPVLVLDVNTWIGKAKLSAESWEVRQVIDPVNISASPEAGVACRLTSDVAAAQGADAVRDPVCLLEWEQTPDEAEPVEAEVGGLKLTGLQGQAVAMGEQPVSYSLYLFSGDGRKIRVGGGERTLTVTSAFGSVAYKPMGDVDEVYRVIQEFDVRMKQSMGPACTLTLDATRAQDAAANRQVGSAASTCLFEWIDIPDGMQQDSYSESPYLFGTLREQKVHTLRWRVSIFTRNGTRVTLATESYDIEAVDPPLPTVDVMSSYQYSDDLYMVPMQGGYLGDAVIEGEPSPLDVRMTRDSEVLTNETFQPGRSIYNKVFRRMETEEAALWDETVFNIEAAYNLLPEVKVEKTLRAIAVPGDDITPQIDVGVSEALDTAPLPVTVRISDRLNPEMSYDPAVMGEWAIRLVREESFDDVVPMTDFVDAPNGEVQFNLDLTGIERSVRLVAQARLKSPIEGYERIEDSQRVFMTVLRGGAIDASVEGRRLSGAAPFTTILQLELENRADMAATGDVIWEISADDGATWESHRSTDRNRFRWYRTYDKGEYLVRAKLLNVNSGAESYTETIEVIAYDTPKVEIEGARTLFVGTEATYTVKVTGPDGEPMENPVIKWTQDRGETFFHEGDTLTLTSEEAKRFSMEAWVRDATAPDDDRYAYTRERVYADFRVVKGPRVFMTGPRVIETGKEYEYLVRLSLPYKGMEGEVEGYFTLPNGEKVEGDTLTYTPTEADLALGSMELLYTAWVKGYRDQGTEASRDIRARVWEYVWPEFNLYMRSSADMAPAEVTARVREIAFRGQLDEPQYQWEFPESDAFVVTENRWDDMRTFQINEPGTYPVKVTITDARGNVAVLEETLEIGEAPPYVVEINYSASNDYNREPLELRMRPYVTGGHPRDRVEQRIYTVDGKEVESSGYSARAVLEKGSHEVGLTIRTRMGKEVTQTMTVDVAENQPPVCSVRIDDRYSSWALYAECEDVDGDMDAFEWTVNGEPVSVRSNRLTLLKSSYEDVLPRVELVGYNDAGDASAKVQAQ